MAFVVQNNSGSAVAANAYITVQEFQDYHEDRCNDTRKHGNPEIQGGIIKATDYLDTRFRFVGEKMNGEGQSTAWPRLDAEDIDDDVRSDVPLEVKEATAEYALIALNTGTSLNPIPDRDSTGQAVLMKRDKVDVIEEVREYAAGAVFRMPKYPDADRKLTASGLAVTGRESRRG